MTHLCFWWRRGRVHLYLKQRSVLFEDTVPYPFSLTLYLDTFLGVSSVHPLTKDRASNSLVKYNDPSLCYNISSHVN